MAQPFTLDGIEYVLTGCVVQFLPIDAIIKKDDFIRKLYDPYKTTDLIWHLTKNDFPAWIGQSYRDYMIYTRTNEPGHELVRVIPLDMEFELALQGKIEQ